MEFEFNCLIWYYFCEKFELWILIHFFIDLYLKFDPIKLSSMTYLELMGSLLCNELYNIL